MLFTRVCVKFSQCLYATEWVSQKRGKCKHCNFFCLKFYLVLHGGTGNLFPPKSSMCTGK